MNQEIQTVVYEMPHLGVHAIPFDSSKNLKYWMDLYPESTHTAFCRHSIEELADLYDQIISWLSPDHAFNPEEWASFLLRLNAYLQEKVLSQDRFDLISDAIQRKMK